MQLFAYYDAFSKMKATFFEKSFWVFIRFLIQSGQDAISAHERKLSRVAVLNCVKLFKLVEIKVFYKVKASAKPTFFSMNSRILLLHELVVTNRLLVILISTYHLYDQC